MYYKNSVLLSILTVIIVLFMSVSADTLELKDGSRLTGKIIAQNEKEVKIKTSMGELNVPRENIARIVKTDAQVVTVYLKDGNKVTGTIKGKTAEQIILKTGVGVLTVKKADIDRIELQGDEPPVKNTADKTAAVEKKVFKDEDKVLDDAVTLVAASFREQLAGKIKTIAINSISVDGNFAVNDKSMESKIISSVVKEGGYRFVDRRALKTLLAEQQLSITGMTADDRQRMGKLLGVDAFMDGTITGKDENSVELSLNLQETETSKVIWKETFLGRYTGLEYAAGLSGGIGGTHKAAVTSYNMRNNQLALEGAHENSTTPAAGIYARLAQRLNFTRVFDAAFFTYLFTFDPAALGSGSAASDFQAYSYDSYTGDLSQTESFKETGEPVLKGYSEPFSLGAVIRFHPFLFGNKNDLLIFHLGFGEAQSRYRFQIGDEKLAFNTFRFFGSGGLEISLKRVSLLADFNFYPRTEVGLHNQIMEKYQVDGQAELPSWFLRFSLLYHN
ncbi:MAG TPA: CsgG/HfaB family protein [Spirochaetota bacterium]|nr:CsgG/HfaB family protein [Spirochaetota bacterium]